MKSPPGVPKTRGQIFQYALSHSSAQVLQPGSSSFSVFGQNQVSYKTKVHEGLVRHTVIKNPTIVQLCLGHSCKNLCKGGRKYTEHMVWWDGWSLISCSHPLWIAGQHLLASPWTASVWNCPCSHKGFQ